MSTRSAIITMAAAILPAGAGQANDFEIVAPSETAITVEDGVVTARLSTNGCASGFEKACTATRQRVEYLSGSTHVHGDKIAYRWEINVPKDNVLNAVDNHLYATRFLAGNTSVLQFIVGNDYGYEVNRKTCFGPEAFGEWHEVEVRVVWDSTKKKGLKDKTPGEIQVRCDDIEILSTAGRPNIKPGDRVNFAFGIEGALKLAEGDQFSVSYRNIEVGNW